MRILTNPHGSHAVNYGPGGRLRFKHIHFAGHVRESSNPLDSSLRFGDELLVDARTIANSWQLDADLVFLAGCASNLGARTRSEGHLGLSQAFMVAGSRSVIASQWPLDDAATALISRRFYELLQSGDSPSVALAKSKKWLRELTNKQLVALAKNDALLMKQRGTTTSTPNWNPDGDVTYSHPYFWAGLSLIGAPK